MGALVTAAAATAGKDLLLGLDASRLRVTEVADAVITTAQRYNAFIAALSDDEDRAFAAARFTESIQIVKGKIEAESPEVQARIVAFFDGMGFVPKAG